MEINTNDVGTGLRWTRRKPDGGFCLIPATDLVTVWFAFSGAIIELVDFRVWLACFELLARRCAAKNGKPPRFRLVELGELTGASPRIVRQSVRRLERAGLLSWSETKIVACARPADLPGEMQADLARTLSFVGNICRLVPVPRRGLRVLAQSRRRVLIATALGHLLRGLYFKQGRCVSGGRCKASWIAGVFGVDERNVKAARRGLVEIGWLLPRASSQTAMNRWGAAFVVNLEHGSEPKRPACESPPRVGPIGTESPPPERNKKLLNGSKNQKPAGRGPAGLFDGNAKKDPCWGRVVPHDLSNAERLRRLFEQACAGGVVRRTQSELLDFFVAAEYARRAATRNPCGLFASLVRKRRWGLNQRDEDTARRSIAALEEAGLTHELFNEMRRRPESRTKTKGHVLPVENRASIAALISQSLSEAACE